MAAGVIIEDPLAAEIAKYVDDPLGYVLDVFPWKEGELAHDDGPDVWQRKFLEDLGAEVRKRNFNGVDPVDPIRMAVASGHGIGKGVMMAWLACWIMDTRPNSQGTVTANTFPQLSTKTWPTICRWRALSITRSWWEVGGERIYQKESKDEFGVPQWFLACQSSAEENNEAFAGQHKKDSTSYYLFDEASAIPAIIWTRADGGLTDGEPMIFAFGNPTRNTGEFYEVAFGHKRHRWNVRSIDSRTCKFPNKAEIDRWIEDYGLDSDKVRVQVLGQPPHQDESQFIGKEIVRSAQQRQVSVLEDEPLVAGFDVSGGGSAWNVIRFRRGLDARPGPLVPDSIRIPGSRTDRAALIARCAQILREQNPRKRVAVLFVDSAFGAPIVERLRTLGFDNAIEVNFGGQSLDQHQANLRAYMWNQMKEWLAKGCIDQNDVKLEIDITGPGFKFDKQNRIVIESKQDMQKRGVPSPDDGDALALTFAAPVAPQLDSWHEEAKPGRQFGSNAWMR